MSKETNPGVLLTRFLEKEWDRLYTTRGAWCRENGLSDSTVYRWSQGILPDLSNLIQVADALGIRLVEVLYHAGYIAEDEMRMRTLTERPQRVDLTTAIRNDPTINEKERQALLALHKVLSEDHRATTRSSTRR